MTVYNAVWAALAAATAFAGPIPATYPNVSFPVKWGNGHVPICDWLTRDASTQGHTDVDAARASVLATLAGVDAAQWEPLNLDSLRPSIEGALRHASARSLSTARAQRVGLGWRRGERPALGGRCNAFYLLAGPVVRNRNSWEPAGYSRATALVP